MKIPALRALVSAWPGVAEDIKWGDNLVFSVCGRMFCATDASGKGALGFKVEAGRFLEMTDRPGIVPAPYLARAHWISLVDPEALPDPELRTLLRGSYALVRAKLTRTLQRALADQEHSASEAGGSSGRRA